MVNRFSFPRAAPPTFLSFPHFHAFRNGSPWMIWDSHSYNMEKPNTNEKEWVMGFYSGTIVMQNISEGACRLILGQVVDVNCFTWIFSIILVKQLCFGQSHPPTPPHLSLVAPFVGSIMLMQSGVMLQQNKYILGNYGIMDAKGHLWVWNKKLMMWGTRT